MNVAVSTLNLFGLLHFVSMFNGSDHFSLAAVGPPVSEYRSRLTGALLSISDCWLL